jgi:YVTN family beta-propeller protein
MIVEKNSHCLSFYDRKTTERLRSIELSRLPHELAVSADRSRAYVSQYGLRNSAEIGDGGSAVAVIDLAELTLCRLIDCRPYGRLHGIALDDAGRLFVLSEAQNVLLGFDDPSMATGPSRAVSTGGIKSHLFAISGDGMFAYCCNLLGHTVTKVCPRDASIASIAVSPGEKPEGLWLNAGGSRLYVTNRQSNTLVAINTASMTVVKSMPTRDDPLRVYGTSDNRLLVLNCGDKSISIIDEESMQETAALSLTGIPLAGHVIGATAFISMTGDICLEIDLTNLAIVRTFQTKSEPDCCFLLDRPVGGHC